MGGKALKHINTSRIDLKTLNKIKKEIDNILLNQNEITIEYPFENPDKTDFGDIDILYKTNLDIDIYNFIKTKFNPKEIVTNGNVISFSYQIDENNYVQIDFILAQIVNLSKFYFSYGDVGQIIGMITKHYDLSFGDVGLFIKHISNDVITKYSNSIVQNIDDKIYLCEDIGEICKYLDLDYSKWGYFASELEIFNWLSSSKLCHPNIFISGNHEHRHKVITRPMYGRFIQWLNFNNKNNLIINDKYFKYNKQEEAIEYFNKKNYLIQIINNHIILLERKQKFNGNKILSVRNIKDSKELGTFIKIFKSHICEKFGSFENWLDINPTETIDNYIKLFNY